MGWETSDLDRLARDLQQAGPKAETLTRTVVKKIGFDTVAGAQNLVPVDTGNLKNTIGQDFDDDGMGFEAGPTASYGDDVEFGTPPHTITANGAGALFWPGAEHPVKSVQHPGTPPQPYMIPAFERAVKPIDSLMGQVGEKALNE